MLITHNTHNPYLIVSFLHSQILTKNNKAIHLVNIKNQVSNSGKHKICLISKLFDFSFNIASFKQSCNGKSRNQGIFITFF